MKVTIELTPAIVEGIANQVATENAYDWSCEQDNPMDIDRAYASAFADGMNYLLKLIEQ